MDLLVKGLDQSTFSNRRSTYPRKGRPFLIGGLTSLLVWMQYISLLNVSLQVVFYMSIYIRGNC